tara:strand:+ start:118 stop:432 length:315 start_codon:yes stop_codon:yes gene_type:complete
MSIFAHVINGVVVNTIVASQSFIDAQDGLFIKSNDDDIIIKNISAGIGYTYDDINDVFISPQRYPSWSLDDNYEWKAPITKPIEGEYVWDEFNQEWIDYETYLL